MGRRDLRDPAAVFGEPVLGRRAGAQLHLDLDDPVLHEGAAGARIPKNHKFRLWGTAVSEPPPFTAFGVKTIGWWGMTETITHGIVGEVDQPNTPMSIGRAAPEYQIRVVEDDGTPTAVGDTGDLLIKGIPGLSLFAEYLHNEKATRESFDEHGYFITGDRVTLLENGFI